MKLNQNKGQANKSFLPHFKMNRNLEQKMFKQVLSGKSIFS